MRKKMLLIYNPCSGKGKIKIWLSDIIETFVAGGYEVVVYSTQRNKDATHIVMDCLERDNYDKIVCSGGDGTLNEVINGIMLSGKKVILGYIPSGTTNDFAYSLGIPKNMRNAAKVVLNGEPFACDVGSINGEFFTYTAAFGIFTDASYETPQSTKNALGRIAYILEGIKRLPFWKSYEMTIVSEDTMVSGEFIYGMITNSNSVGGFKGITGKEVLLDDGEFEGIFIKVPQSVLDLQEIINNLLKGILNSDLIISVPVKQIQVESKELVPWTIDGEFGGEFNKVEIINNKQAISIMHRS